MGQKGGAAVAWRSTGFNMSLRTQSVAGVWDDAVVASTTDGIEPRVAMGFDGSVIVSWQPYAYGLPPYGFVRRYGPGQGLVQQRRSARRTVQRSLNSPASRGRGQ